MEYRLCFLSDTSRLLEANKVASVRLTADLFDSALPRDYRQQREKGTESCCNLVDMVEGTCGRKSKTISQASSGKMLVTEDIIVLTVKTKCKGEEYMQR